MERIRFKFVLLPMLLLLVIGCSDKTSPTLELSQTEFKNLSYDETQINVDIVSNETWTATSSASWCALSTTSGTGDTRLIMSIAGNINTERTATVTINSNSLTQTVQITQRAMPSGEEYHYRLPVIFHVLYKDENDTLQYIKQERLAYLLNAVNNLYQNSRSSVDMNLEFTLATTDENGNTLATPGVEYVYWQNIPMDCNAFMNDKTGQYVPLLWDPNKYINVMLYNFTSDNSGSITLGITHLPFSTKGSTYLEGLSSISQTSLVKSNLAFPYCASINSLYIYEESGEYYNSADATVTLAHELGHYIGLHHPFSENANGSLNPNCINSDYCDDTPTYDRNAYGEVLAMLLKKSNVTMSEAATREDCNTSEEFIGRNIMDYEVCYSDQFTSDQRARIRHVLAYSPLIPGPKKTTTTTKSIVYEGPLDLPILYRKCGYKMIDGAYPRFITSISDKNSWFE